jgi:hypothetical protein
MEYKENQEMISYLKIPLQFDEKKLIADLEVISKNLWIPHFNKEGYRGKWNSVALYAKGGESSNIFALNNDDAIIETPILKNCAYFKEVINHFKFPLLSVRLLRLEVGAYIKPHTDYNLGYENNNFRLHIPIKTNEDVHFILDGKRLKMLPGECWYTNVNFVHSVANNGKTDRIHLVLDGKRNEWSDNLFFSLAPKERFFNSNREKHSLETLQKIIEELKRSNQPAAKDLIIKLQKELNTLKRV